MCHVDDTMYQIKNRIPRCTSVGNFKGSRKFSAIYVVLWFRLWTGHGDKTKALRLVPGDYVIVDTVKSTENGQFSWKIREFSGLKGSFWCLLRLKLFGRIRLREISLE